MVALGAIALVGWALERRRLTELGFGSSSLKVNTALCFVALGVAVMLRGTERQRLRTVLEVVAGVIAVATIVETLHGATPGIDELLFDDPFSPAGAGRMSLGTAIALALTAFGLLGLDSLKQRVRIAAHVPLLVAGGIGLVGLVGYASGLDSLYWRSDLTTMAVPTAAGILLLVAAGLVLAPGEGIIAVVLRPSAGGRLLRRLLPVVVLVPTAFLIPIGRGADRGLYGFDVGVLLFLIGTMAVSLPVVFWTARSLDVAETRAGQEAERFASVLRAATEQSIIGMDVDGVITVFNEGAERMLSYTAEEVVGRETLQLIHDPREVAARARELGVAPGFEVFVAAARRNLAETREWTFVRKDGGRIPVSLTVTAMLASDGSQEGFMGVAFDLSARKELERELRRQADFTGTLVGSAPVGIFATDESGACIFVNSKWRELTGLSGEDAHGDGWLRAVHPDDAPQVSHAWEALVVDDTSFAVEYRFRRPDESVVWVASSAVALRNEHGEAEGYLGTDPRPHAAPRRGSRARAAPRPEPRRARRGDGRDPDDRPPGRGALLERGHGGLLGRDRRRRAGDDLGPRRPALAPDDVVRRLPAVARGSGARPRGGARRRIHARRERSLVRRPDRVGARCGRRADGADLLAPRDDTRNAPPRERRTSSSRPSPTSSGHPSRPSPGTPSCWRTTSRRSAPTACSSSRSSSATRPGSPDSSTTSCSSSSPRPTGCR